MEITAHFWIINSSKSILSFEITFESSKIRVSSNSYGLSTSIILFEMLSRSSNTLDLSNLTTPSSGDRGHPCDDHQMTIYNNMFITIKCHNPDQRVPR